MTSIVNQSASKLVENVLKFGASYNMFSNLSNITFTVKRSILV